MMAQSASLNGGRPGTAASIARPDTAAGMSGSGSMTTSAAEGFPFANQLQPSLEKISEDGEDSENGRKEKCTTIAEQMQSQNPQVQMDKEQQ